MKTFLIIITPLSIIAICYLFAGFVANTLDFTLWNQELKAVMGIFVLAIAAGATGLIAIYKPKP